MCGIFGVFDNQNSLKNRQPELEAARDTLRHRGPDGEGSFLSSEGKVYLGNRRLAIIDLSGGRQPMTSPDGRYTIVFNGEIYNYKELRRALQSQGHVFKTNSDTEVLLYYFIQHPTDYFKDLRGPYAFAVYDAHTQKLILSRDPSGQKPIYYLQHNHQFAFASELSALKDWFKDFPWSLGKQELQLYLNNYLVPPPYTIFKSVFKMMPGHELAYQVGKLATKNILPSFFADRPTTSDLYTLLDKTIQLELTSDVPVACLLSGGIDSSIIAALAKRHNPRLHTFSIFWEKTPTDHPDLVLSRKVAAQLKTTHREVRFSINDYKKHIQLIQDHFGEPFSRPSIYFWSILFSEIKKDFKVVLSGNGGDEVFGGYPETYRNVRKRNSLLQKTILNVFPQGLAEKVYDWSSQTGQETLQMVAYLLAQPAAKRSGYRRSYKARQLNACLKKDIQLNGYDPDAVFEATFAQTNGDILKKWMYTDLFQRNQEIVTIDADIISMAHSVETRAPFLNQAILQYFARQDSADLIDGRSYKKPLVPILEKLDLGYLVNRPKIGFDGGLTTDPCQNLLENVLENRWTADIFAKPEQLSPELRLKEYFLRDYIRDFKVVA